MRSASALLTAALLAGCLDAPSDGGQHLVVVPNFLNGQHFGEAVVVVDVSAGPEGADGWQTARLAWPIAGDPGQLVVPCDPTANPHEARVSVMGLYADAPAQLGEWGSPAPPDSLSFQNPGELSQAGECHAGVDTTVTLDIALMRAAQQGFFDIAINVDAGNVRDAIWELRVLAGDVPATLVWEQRIFSSEYGDGSGNCSYAGPCTAEPGMEENRVAVRFVSLHDAPIVEPHPFLGTPPGYGRFGGPIPPDAIEVWDPPPGSHTIACPENENVFTQFDVTLARVERDDDVVRARFAGLLCGAMWRCSEGDPANAELEIRCDNNGDSAPTLHIEDLVLQCNNTEVARIAPDLAAVSFDQPAAGSPSTTWRITPFAATAPPAGPCTLTGRATAPPGPGHEAKYRIAFEDGAVPAGTVYPMLTWRLAVGDADGFVCDPARLSHGGPITVTYTATEATEPTRFAHRTPAPIETP